MGKLTGKLMWSVPCSRLFPNMKPFVELPPQPAQTPAPNPAQHYAELLLEDIISPADEPAKSDTAPLPGLEPALPGSSMQQQGPPQDPRRSRVQHTQALAPQHPSAAATEPRLEPALPGSSLQQGLPQDPRRGRVQYTQGLAPQNPSIVALEPPRDPRLAAGGPQHAQHAVQDPRKAHTVLEPSQGHSSASSAPELLLQGGGEAALPSGLHMNAGNTALPGDEDQLYSSALGPGTERSERAQQHAAGSGKPHTAQGSVGDASAEQLLYDDPLLLGEDEHGEICSPQRAIARHQASEAATRVLIPGLNEGQASDSAAVPEVLIPGLDESQPFISAAQHHSSRPSQGVHSSRRPHHFLGGAQGAAVEGTAHPSACCAAGAVTALSDQSYAHSAAGVSQCENVVPGRVGQDGSSMEQGAQRPGLPKPVTLPTPGMPTTKQALPAGVPKPITLKASALGSRGGGGFKAHTMDYKR